MVYALEQELFQVLMNILSNAKDAVDIGGTVNITTNIKNKNLYIYIKDNGSGISEDNIEHIFDPFFTTKSEMLGTGLGLSISKKIIESFNGEIKVKSKPGKGTTFILVLQIAE